MAEFDSGVAGYVHAVAIVNVTFPIDHKGRADISCKQCQFFRRNYRICGLNGEICEYPDNYVGGNCPLTRIDDNTDTNNIKEANQYETSGL